MSMSLVVRLVGFIEIAVGAARPLRISLGLFTTLAGTFGITLILVPLRIRHFATSSAGKTSNLDRVQNMFPMALMTMPQVPPGTVQPARGF
jgi:hypothetical protein